MTINNVPYYINDFLNYSIAVQNKSQLTIKEYYYDLRLFLNYIIKKYNYKCDFEKFQLKYLRRITLEDIYDFLAYLYRKGDKSSTRARKSATIRTFFCYAYKKKLIKYNPAQDVESPKIEKREVSYLTLEQSEKMLESSKKAKGRYSLRNYTMITLLLNCGLRLSELVGIDIEDIDSINQKINVIGKGNKERTIYLNESCIQAINNFLIERKKKFYESNRKNPLFVSERGDRISNRTVQHIVKREFIRIGLDPQKYSVHKLRHTSATLMYRYGNVDIRTLQIILGHENISTTQIYTHIDDEKLRDAFNCNPLNKKRRKIA